MPAEPTPPRRKLHLMRWIVALSVLMIGVAILRRNRMVSDSVLIERWRTNRAAFEELLAETRKQTANRSQDSERSKMLKEKLGIRSASGNENVGYGFYAYSSGNMLGGVDKGYLYCEAPRGTLEQSLDSIDGKQAWVQYLRPIEGNWYVFLLIDD
ncbi:MAG: hypothetical protein RL088_1278 [Verrucomicrobiota bacterium]|jgi:hypothetical protein